MEQPLFSTITCEDWKRSLEMARREPNKVSQKIKERFKTMKPLVEKSHDKPKNRN